MKRVSLVAILLTIALVFSALATDTLAVCSFNICWLGNFAKNCEALGLVLSSFDVVVIQEIVAPPYAGTFPNGEAYRPDPEVAAFFDEMTKVHGYKYLLSEQDTGSSGKTNDNSPHTEWYAVFYDPSKLQPASDLPTGFLASDVTAYRTFDRIPYAFSLRHPETGFDFVLISVHLHREGSPEGRGRREGELAAIASWIDAQTSNEEHYIVLGDMNFQDCDEILAIIPGSFLFLNPDRSGNCVDTNTSLKTERPYANALYTQEVPMDLAFGMRVIDLVSGLAAIWNPMGEPIEEAYDELDFVKQFSDHNPIIFTIQVPSADWD